MAEPGSARAPRARSIVCIGEALMDFVATEPGLPLGRAVSFELAPGGAPANVAVGIARLGGASAFVGRVGRDQFGRAIADELLRSGVDVVGLRFDDRAPTTLAFAFTGDAGEDQFVFCRNGAADTRLDPVDLDPSRIRNAALLHVGTVSLSTEPSASAIRRALELATDAGVPRSCDVNLRDALWSSQDEMLEQARQLVASCDIVKASDDEAARLTGETAPASAARALHALGPRLVVVTSAAGASFALDGDARYVPGFPARVVDTTGAGDAFTAALLFRIVGDRLLDGPLDGEAICDAVTLGNAAGSLATRRRGAIPALPKRDELEALAATRASAGGAVPLKAATLGD